MIRTIRYVARQKVAALAGLLIWSQAIFAQGWPQRYEGAGGVEKAAGIAIDQAGNVYVTGKSERSKKTRFDYCTVKYDSAGTRQWVRIYDGPPNPLPSKSYNLLFRNADQPAAIDVDAQCNVYVTGGSYGNERNRFGLVIGAEATIKYDTNGTVKWIRRYAPVDVAVDPAAMVVDAAGNAYITGTARWATRRDLSDSSTMGWFVLKYDTNGTLKWIQPGKGDFRPQHIRLSPSGDIWIAGITEYGGDHNVDITLKRFPTRKTSFVRMAFDVEGHRKETRTYDTRAGVFRYKAMLDEQGNLYGQTLEDNWNVLLSKFDAAGLSQWHVPIATFPDSLDQAFAIDGHGDVYVPGRLSSEGSLQRVELTVYGAAGQRKGSKSATYSDPHYGFTAAQVTFDRAGHVYIAGTTAYSANPSDDFLILRFDVHGP